MSRPQTWLDTPIGNVSQTYDEAVALGHTARGRTILAVLTERGHYEETPDSFEWAIADAGTAVHALEERGDTFRNLWDAFVDVGLHNPDEEPQCLGADVRAVIARFAGADSSSSNNDAEASESDG